MIFCIVLLILSRGNANATNDPDSVLQKLGYSIIPAPRVAKLTLGNILIDESWQLVSKVGDDISVRELNQYVEKFHGLIFKGNQSKKILLSVEEGIVKGSADSELNKQGYQRRSAGKGK